MRKQLKRNANKEAYIKKLKTIIRTFEKPFWDCKMSCIHCIGIFHLQDLEEGNEFVSKSDVDKRCRI